MIAVTDDVKRILADGKQAVAAISVSGGKDSSTVAIETNAYLDSINFTGERILIHSDLGLIEHSQSIEICRRLSERLTIPLIVVRPLREMIERWVYRWQCIVERFINLENVRISTPFSSAQNRFCTSEEKTVPICRFLKKSYEGKTILNIVGIRREESKKRALKPISENNKLLLVKTKGTSGITWLPIADYSIEDVFLCHKKHNFALHEAYTKFGLSRVSCSFCVLAGTNDLRASLTDERNHEAFRQIVKLEIDSTFGFKSDLWLGSLAPEILSENDRRSLERAKEKAIERHWADKMIPKELLFDKDTKFPAFQPNLKQAGELGTARARIADVLGIKAKYTTAKDVYDRYAELLELKKIKEAKKAKKQAKETAPGNQKQLALFN